MDRVEKTVELFGQGLNCSQAMLTVFGEDWGLGPDLAQRLGRPLGGGMGHLALMCGAVSAGVLVLGLSPRDEAEEADQRRQVFGAVQELVRRFEARHGGVDCEVLLGVHLGSPEGMQRIKAENLVARRCPAFVRTVAQALVELTAVPNEAAVSTGTGR